MNIDEFDARIRAVPNGGVTSAQGFMAAGVHAGFRKDPKRLDMALLVADEVCPVAGTFTQNRFCAAPVTVSRAHLGGVGYGMARGVVVNSGNANAATGGAGIAAAHETCDIASQVLGCEPEQVLVSSTGVIGQILDIEPFEEGIPAAADALSRAGGSDAALAIMTTDTHPKEYAVTYESQAAGYLGSTFTVGGCCKGSGMIMPNMATMIALITTDAPVRPETLHGLLRSAVDQTFNRVTVDSDTSTNDTCIMFASGKAAPMLDPIDQGSDAYQELERAIYVVCEALARGIAADGEGSTKLVTVTVSGAATPQDADTAARAVANSPLVKTAVAGHDCNWGRVAAALGKCGVAFNQEDVDIDIMDIPVCRGGLTVPFDEDEALRRFEAPEIVIAADLGAGDAQATVWTCDFTHDYISINADYRS